MPYERPRPYLVRYINKRDDLAIIEGAVPADPPMPFANLSRDLLNSLPDSSVSVFGFSAKEHYTAPQRIEGSITAFASGYGRIGLNANINSGDSGGPVLAIDNTVLGIAWAKDMTRSGQAMAIPVGRLIELMAENKVLDPCSNSNVTTVKANTISEGFNKFFMKLSTIDKSMASWIFGFIFLFFCLLIFVFAPDELPELQQRILALIFSLFSGLFIYFLFEAISVGNFLVKAIGIVVVFVFSMSWWVSPLSPTKISPPPSLSKSFPMSTSTYITQQGYDTNSKFGWSKISGMTPEVRETVTKCVHRLWPCNAKDVLNNHDNHKISLGTDGKIRPAYCAVRFRSPQFLRIPKGTNIKIQDVKLISSNSPPDDLNFILEVYGKQLEEHELGSNPFRSHLYLDSPLLARNTLIDQFDENAIPIKEIPIVLPMTNSNLELMGSSDNDRFVYLTSKGKHTVQGTVKRAEKISDLYTLPQIAKARGVFYEATPTQQMWTGSIKITYIEEGLVQKDDSNRPPEDIPAVEYFKVELINEQDRKATDYQDTNIEIENQTDKSLILVLTYTPKKLTGYAHKFYDIPQKGKIKEKEVNFGGPYHISIYFDGKWFPMRKWYDLGITSTRKVIIDDASGSFRCNVDF